LPGKNELLACWPKIGHNQVWTGRFNSDFWRTKVPQNDWREGFPLGLEYKQLNHLFLFFDKESVTMFRKLVVTHLILALALFLAACSTAGGRNSASADNNEQIGAAALADLAALGWDVSDFTAEVEAVERNYARVLIRSHNPPGGFTAFLHRQEGWQVIAHGSAFNPAQLQKLGMPNSVLGPYSGGLQPEPSAASVVERLQQSGARVELTAEDLQQPFFTVYGEIVRLNGQDVQLFNYPSEADALGGRGGSVARRPFRRQPYDRLAGHTLLLPLRPDVGSIRRQRCRHPGTVRGCAG
jgi:hypothetical protein